MRGPSVDEVVLRGRGLHSASASGVRFVSAPGEPVAIAKGGRRVAIEELRVEASERNTVVTDLAGVIRVATVEHLLAAFAGLSVRTGVVVEIEGPEIPLLDGGAGAFVAALRRLEVAEDEPSPMRIVRAGEVEVGRSRYTFTPSAAPRIDVSLSFDELARTSEASWDGTSAQFVREIATARTFGLAHEVMALVERGLAAHVAPESVVVLGKDDVLWAGRPFEESEPARHKLLDLLGDLFLHGGPPADGLLHATRPGHAATHAAMREAAARGLVAVSDRRPARA